MTVSGHFRTWLVVAAPLLAAAPLAAQTATDGASVPPATQPSAVVVEQIENVFVVAPDVRFTEVNDEYANLAGGYGGVLIDQQLLIGGGGYWLTNRADDFKMAYLGGVVGWYLRGRGPFDVGVSSLVGGGEATLATTYGDYFGTPPEPMPFGRDGFSRFRPPTSDAVVRVRDGFFVAEPQVNLAWRAVPWMTVTGGVGYRLVAGAHRLNDKLRGVSGNLSIAFGVGS